MPDEKLRQVDAIFEVHPGELAAVRSIERKGDGFLVHYQILDTGRELFDAPTLTVSADIVIVSAARTPVGSFKPNALGLYDMSGNAWEWCTDSGGSDYPAAKQINPCAQGGKNRIVRGGTWDTDAKACRASARIDWRPNEWCWASGFRVALTP